jgi:hypothetical protein
MLNDFPREMMAIWALPVRKEEKKNNEVTIFDQCL